MIENTITQRILKCAFKVHTKLGPGLLESAYQECLFYELIKEGLNVVKEKPMPLIYDEVKLDTGYRIDLFVNGKVVIEVKAVEGITDVHLAQILTYLKLSDSKVGLLLNFNVKSMKHGVKRVINTKGKTLRDSVPNSNNSVVKIKQ
ncbi:MAG: GxxExxY protein [Saprospiraceae bacterium]|nr:GxxExxY protein [Saprospiraceae bacterium]